jgi:predicted DCC family thiol-disulfide oxidoreductase YuxK
MSAQYSHLVVYDGVCMLCNRLIQHLLAKDKRQILTFSSFQGLPDVLSKNGLQFPLEESISYYRKGRWWQQSSAVLMIYRDVFGPGHWSQLAWIFPRFFRDFIYRIIAKNRYRWFGKHAHCVLPTPAQKDRFIG